MDHALTPISGMPDEATIAKLQELAAFRAQMLASAHAEARAQLSGIHVPGYRDELFARYVTEMEEIWADKLARDESGESISELAQEYEAMLDMRGNPVEMVKEQDALTEEIVSVQLRLDRLNGSESVPEHQIRALKEEQYRIHPLARRGKSFQQPA